MEQNLPIITKKAWNLIRVMFFMLKKGISKAKFITNLNMMIKRGKIASKSLHNLLFHHHKNWAVATFPRHLPPPQSDDENELSCTTTPQNQNKDYHGLDANDAILKALEILASATASPALSRFGKSPMVKQLRITDSPFPFSNGDEDGQVLKALEILTTATASPALSRFGKSPMVKELRITDSPFPLSNGDEDGDQVDEAAEKFIMRFYNNLRGEN